ncbi:MAG: flippase [Ruminococcus sp.]|nr:flippase [Ruminococcus sp.]
MESSLKKKSVKRNYLYNLSYEILLLLTPLVTTPYVSRVLGAEGVGLYSYSSSVVSYFALFAVLGTVRYGQREISCMQDQLENRSKFFWEVEALTLFTTLLSIICFLTLVFIKGLPLVYLVQIFTILSSFVDITWFFQGMEEFGKIALRNSVFRILSVISIFLFVNDANDTAIYALVMVLWVFLGHISLWFYLPEKISRPKMKELKPWRHFKPTLGLFIPAVAVSIYTVLDKTMIGIITGSNVQNGYYEQAYKLSRIMLTVITSLGTALLPRVAYNYENNNLKKAQEYIYKGYNVVWFLGTPMCLGLVGIARNFVPWFFGDDFIPAIPCMQLMSGLLIIVGISNITGYEYLVGTKRENLFTRSVICGAIVNFLLNLVLINTAGAFGATVATIIAESVIAGYQLFLVRNELQIPYILRISIKYLIAGGIMLIALMLENNILKSSILNTFVMIFTGCFIYFLILLILKDSFLISNTKRILQRLRGRLNLNNK